MARSNKFLSPGLASTPPLVRISRITLALWSSIRREKNARSCHRNIFHWSEFEFKRRCHGMDTSEAGLVRRDTETLRGGQRLGVLDFVQSEERIDFTTKRFVFFFPHRPNNFSTGNLALVFKCNVFSGRISGVWWSFFDFRCVFFF